jgi:hypothetical protein
MNDDDRSEAFWAEREDEWVEHLDDDEGLLVYPEADASDKNLDVISRMLSALRRLNAEVAAYDKLDAIERRRLDRQRDVMVGPMVRRIGYLQMTITSFAVMSYRDFGKTRIGTPNGTITSNATKPALTVDDEVAGQWFETTDRGTLVKWAPKVPVNDLRDWLNQACHDGELVRCIVTTRTIDTAEGDVVEVTETVIAPDVVWRKPFAPDQTGRYRVAGDPNDPNHETYLPGVYWGPSGEDATGRNFHVKPA